MKMQFFVFSGVAAAFATRFVRDALMTDVRTQEVLGAFT